MTIGSWHRKATIEPANSRLAAVKLTLWCRRKTAAPVKGYRMPAAHGPCGELRRQASDKPKGGSRGPMWVRRCRGLELWGFKSRG